MNKKLNTETTADDLLMLPDIDGIVKDIKGQKTISGQSKADSQEKPSEDVPADTDNAPVSDGGSSWEVFLRCSQGYGVFWNFLEFSNFFIFFISYYIF